MSGAPTFKQPVDIKCVVLWLRVLARRLPVVHSDFCLRH